MKKRTKIILAVLAALLLSVMVAIAIYANDYYRAVEVNASLESSESVRIKNIGEGYFFDGPGQENALIFYPGGKVEETAYAPLLRQLAEQGVDCFLSRMPMKLAIFGMNEADKILKNYHYTHYYLAGHSLGGAMAANYAAEHTDEYAGLFLLAAYPSKDLREARFPVVFIYGENDGVLNREKLKASFSLVPEDYRVVKIPGGNHARFGSYGIQSGDGTATISAAEQQRQTANEILKTVKSRNGND